MKRKGAGNGALGLWEGLRRAGSHGGGSVRSAERALASVGPPPTHPTPTKL